jgi:prophage regulatory protein
MQNFDLEFLSVANVAARYGVAVVTIWRWSRTGRLPQPVHFSPGCTRWRLSDLEKFEAKAAK